MPALKSGLKRIAMRHTLPVLLLIVSMLLFVDGQHQFHGAVFGGELRFWDRFPPPAERLERSISFPAEVLRAPIDAMPIMNRRIFGTSLGRTWPLVLSLNDLAGFACLGFFWFVVGFHLDAWRRPTLSRFQVF